MTKNTSKRTLFLYPDEVQLQRINVAYATNRRAWKRDKNGHWRKRSQSEFMLELISDALDRGATFEGSRVVLAGRFGKTIATQLDSHVFLLRVLIDLFCLALHISDKQRNEAFLRAATDPKFGSRLIDFRAYYSNKMHSLGKIDTEMEER